MEPNERERRVAELIGEIDILQTELAMCLRALLNVIAEHPVRTKSAHPPRDVPVIDDQTFSVHWRGVSCQLGCTLAFKILRRLARRPNFHVSYDQLRDDVWRHTYCADSTIRSQVRHLRQHLRSARMEDLAAAIKSRKRQFVLAL